MIGLSALVQTLEVEAPVRKPSCVSKQRIKELKKDTGEWRIFDSKYAVEDTVTAHLTFSLRHEDLDLLVLKLVFAALPEKEITSYVKSAPTGPIVRRVWFLYEFLTGKRLNVPDSGKVTTIDLLDSEDYFVSEGIVSTRHRIRNNLLGTQGFCPVIRRTDVINQLISKRLSDRAHNMIRTISTALIARASSFLLLADTQASFAIEGERLPINTKERWLRAVQQAGKHPLSKDELNRLHSILIGDYRFIKPGLRTDSVFIGERFENEPIPEFIGARPQDLDDLVNGLVAASLRMSESSLDAVVQASAIAFGFIYIHPYDDGNGRLHRCLIHQILQERKFSPAELVFPISSVMLKWIDEYKTVLQNHSRPLMTFINWVPTERGNVDVKNDTADLYRYFDCTEAAEFLYRCVEETIDEDIPREIDYLTRHDKAMQQILNQIEMPNRLAEDFIMFMRQNKWQLPKRRRNDEFKELTGPEVESLESIVRTAFDGFEAESSR